MLILISIGFLQYFNNWSDIIFLMKWLAVAFLGILVIVFAFVVTSNKTQIENSVMRATSSPQTTSTPDPNSPITETIATGLQVPWAIIFLPNSKDMLVTECTGFLVKISGGNKTTIATLPSKQIGEGGLLGMTLDPEFSNNHYIYFYYTYSENGALNRIVRYKFENDKLSDEKILVDKIPGNSNHDGGRLKFGPDGFLYATTGDASDPSHAQEKNSLSGKILRMTRDGSPAPGNPFGTLVYSYGHRNPQGLAWDNGGQLWSTEHGRSAPTGYDELNKIEAGKNYGWDTIQGSETRDGMVTPVINSGANNTWAPAGAIFLNGKIYFGGLKGAAIYEYDIAKNSINELFKNQFGRIRDVELGPDGAIYISTSNQDGRGNPIAEDDRIIKINPSKL